MLLRARDEVAACDVCGASVAARRATWCGGCGALLAADATAPTDGPATSTPPTSTPTPPPGRRATPVVIVLGVVVAAAVILGLTATDVAVPVAETTWVPLAGRVDDATGRSSTGPPLPDLVRRWSATAAPSDAWSLYELPTIGLGGELLAIGDRLVRIADGAVLGSSDVALAGAWEAPTPDGLVALAEPGELRMLDPVDGTAVRTVPIPELATDGRIVDWGGDVAVVDVFDDGPGTVLGVDQGSGEVRWRFRGDVWASLDDRWAIGWSRDTESDGVEVLLDVRTGTASSLPAGVGGRLAGPPVSDGTRMVAPVEDGVVAWEPASGDVLWRTMIPGPTRATALAVAGGRVLVVEGAWGDGGVRLTTLDATTGVVVTEPRAAASAPPPPLSGPAAVGDELVALTTATGLRWVTVDGTGTTDVGLPDLLSIVAVEAGDAAFVAITGTLAPGDRTGRQRARVVGDAIAIVFDARGTELNRVAVRPVALGPGYGLGPVLDGRIAVTPAAVAPGYADVRFVGVEDGDVDPPDVALSRWVGRVPGRSEAVLVGALAGGPGPGGLAPLLWRPSPHAIVVRDGVVELDGEEVAVGRRPVVADGVLAVAVAGGTLLQPLPSAGEGLVVDRVVGAAVGATTPRGAVPRTVATRAAVLVPEVVPVAAAGRLLLAAASGTGEDGTGLGTLVAVDAVSGDELWRSDLVVRVDPTASGPLGSLPGFSGAMQVLHDGADGPIVVDTGGAVVALERASGAQLWRATASTPRRSGAALVGAHVVVATAGGAEAFDARTGAAAWAVDTGGLVTAFGAAGTTTLLGTAGGDVVVVDRDGTVTDRLAGAADRVDDVAVVDGWVLAVHYDGTVVAFGPRPSAIDSGDEVGVPEPATTEPSSAGPSR